MESRKHEHLKGAPPKNPPLKSGHLKSPGLAFLSAGVAFMTVALSTGRTAFIGVACTFIALGAVFLGKSRQGAAP